MDRLDLYLELERLQKEKEKILKEGGRGMYYQADLCDEAMSIAASIFREEQEHLQKHIYRLEIRAKCGKIMCSEDCLDCLLRLFA